MLVFPGDHYRSKPMFENTVSKATASHWSGVGPALFFLHRRIIFCAVSFPELNSPFLHPAFQKGFHLAMGAVVSLAAFTLLHAM
ncbi:hypothetical protein UYSO10_3960 [Kosakonia radicincitans]|uniref:hypothetical protein n=1 Tax=Kosakonia radicincitans TaxID=283686 RepID=UPI000ACA7BB7|nr:hypothetical protein [Kosakonia radicincitans]MDD7993610.1 hypothetical protein [Kosakonia radicincitans]VVT52280.1 hypothetical protein UYSO10_3960 [Kosakonia radicincitans]